MKTLILILTLLFSVTVFSQHEKDPKDDGRTIKIPVVFHIIHKNKTEILKRTTNDSIKRLIKSLNDIFLAKNDMSLVDSKYDSVIGNPNISFYLDENNSFNGIKRYKRLSNWNKKFNRIAFNKYKCLNIFIGKIGTNSMVLNDKTNTVFIRLDYFLKDKSSSAAHEIGHWLGLLHPWGWGNCRQAKRSKVHDDFIPDTPFQQACSDVDRKEKCLKVDKTATPNYNNFMDYSGCRYFFTKAQSQMMRNKIIKYKPSLFNNSQ